MRRWCFARSSSSSLISFARLAAPARRLSAQGITASASHVAYLERGAQGRGRTLALEVAPLYGTPLVRFTTDLDGRAFDLRYCP